jgi:hypothetical protein
MPVVSSTAYSQAREVLALTRSLLNDLGYNGYPVQIASAVRATNVVTVQTQTPHGLVTNDQTIISGVTGGATSFNGTFTVTYVSTFVYTYLQTGGNESANVNTGTSAGKQDALGVGLGVIFPDPILIPYLNSTYRRLQRALAMTGATLFRVDNLELVVAKVTTVDPSAQVSITEATAPPNQLPPDLIMPLKLWERLNLSTDAFVEMNNLTYAGGLPSREQGERLQEWEFRSDGLFFVGATQDTQIRLRYQKALPNLSDGASSIGIRNSQEYLSFGIAAQACNARGSPLAEKWDTAAEDSLEALVAASTRQQQFSPRRRRPYGIRSYTQGPIF